MIFVSTDTPLPFPPSRSDCHVLVAAERNRVLMTGGGCWEHIGTMSTRPTLSRLKAVWPQAWGKVCRAVVPPVPVSASGGLLLRLQSPLEDLRETFCSLDKKYSTSRVLLSRPLRGLADLPRGWVGPALSRTGLFLRHLGKCSSLSGPQYPQR